MEAEKFKLPVLLDLCGGTEEAVRAMFPHLELAEGGLWLDGHASDDLALPIDEQDARSQSPNLQSLRVRRVEAERAGWGYHPARNSGVAVLPVPFSAPQLAAFMLSGDGLNLHNRFDFGAVAQVGDLLPLLDDADDERKARRAAYVEELCDEERNAGEQFEGALRALGDNADEAREVLREAIKLRRIADERFGRSDAGVRASAKWLLSNAARLGSPTPESSAVPAKRLTWRETVGPDIVAFLKDHKFGTAKELYHALEGTAGGPASPFDKGIGVHRGKLVVRHSGRPLSLKTVQNEWAKLRKASNMG